MRRFQSCRRCEIWVDLCCKNVALCSYCGTIGTAQIKCLQNTTQRIASKNSYGRTCFSVRHQSLQSQYIDTFSALKFCYFCWSKTISDSFRKLVPFTPFSCAYIITIGWNGLKSIINFAQQLPVCRHCGISQGWNREYALRLCPSHRTLWNLRVGFKAHIPNMKCCWLHWSKFLIHTEYAENK